MRGARERERERVFEPAWCEGDIEFVSTNTYWQSIDPEGIDFPFPSLPSLDGWCTAVLEKEGREGKKKMSSSYVSVDNAIKENPILRITVNRFSSFWLVFSREKQILRDKLGIASKLSFRFFSFFFLSESLSLSLFSF